MLFIFVLLSALFTQTALAIYDFDLVFVGKKEYKTEFEPPLLEIRDGKLEYVGHINHPLWEIEYTLSGTYLPKDNKISGSFSRNYYNRTGYLLFEIWGDFYISPIEGENLEIHFTIHYYNNKHVHWMPELYLDYGVVQDYPPYEKGTYKVVWLKKPEIEETQYVDSGARFSGLSGEVEVWHYDEDPEDAKVAKLNMVLYVGDYVRTGEISSAIIQFMDMTTFIMKPETTVIIPSPAAKENLIKLLWGNLMTNVKKMFKDGSLDVEMGQAVAGIKGTIFVAEERNGISSLKVIEGEVQFRSKSTGETQIVKAGEQIYADKSGLGPKATFNIEEGMKTWESIEKEIQSTKQEGATQSASQIIQVALPIILQLQAALPIILIVIILTFIITLAKRTRAKRK